MVKYFNIIVLLVVLRSEILHQTESDINPKDNWVKPKDGETILSKKNSYSKKNVYHPYFNPLPAKNEPNLRREPILAKSKPVDPNDPIVKHKEFLGNLGEKDGLLLENLDHCITQIVDRNKKFGKHFVYIRCRLGTEMFEEPKKDFPEFAKIKLQRKTIVMPIAINERKHYVALVADTIRKNVEYYNSQDPTLTREKFHTQALTYGKIFRVIINQRNRQTSDKIDLKGWRLIQPKFTTPTQVDSVNCGTYVMMYIDGRMNGNPAYGTDVFQYRDAVLQRYVDQITKKPVRKTQRKKIVPNSKKKPIRS